MTFMNTLQEKNYRKAKLRIKSLVNQGLDICSEYQPDQSSSFNSISCSDCGYSQEIHMIRDLVEVIEELNR